ncbi:hypothetical protein SAMN04487907_1011119 [Zunongwangia mangrovi]|jgi:CxxC motif-containing protein|uniref:Lipoprotein n=1 Tax=Zunongwangia mangrovi TaxID=1334022 RepID=A0A1I1EV87_9FLAO|nr:hypothetical protein [Zunongwangia mangrovi]SFB90596.1 hypothetical protein SAMN04487907_1011119 [Zunongwangia mangrovi]
MKRLILLGGFMAISATTFLSCREEPQKTVVKEVEVEKTENEGVLERTAKKVDKKVNEEIDEEIDKIGDDN